MEGFNHYDPVSKRRFQRQNIISPIISEALPSLAATSTTPLSIEDYNAFLSAEQRKSQGAMSPDYGNLYNKFLNLEKVKQEHSFTHRPLKNERLEWCNFSPLPSGNHSTPQVPSFRATINPSEGSIYAHDPTSRYLQSTIPESKQMPQPPAPPQDQSMYLFPEFQKTLHQHSSLPRAFLPAFPGLQIPGTLPTPVMDPLGQHPPAYSHLFPRLPEGQMHPALLAYPPMNHLRLAQQK